VSIMKKNQMISAHRCRAYASGHNKIGRRNSSVGGGIHNLEDMVASNNKGHQTALGDHHSALSILRTVLIRMSGGIERKAADKAKVDAITRLGRINNNLAIIIERNHNMEVI